MGAGKTVVGKRLAKSLGLSFYDLDAEIEMRYKMSVSAIFQNFDESCFRKLETETLKMFSEKDDCIVSCGGGTPCFNDNMSLINSLGVSVYIKMPAKALANRIINSHKKRPLASGKTESELVDYVEKTLAVREPFYAMANISVDGINLDKNELSEKIRQMLGKSLKD